MQKSKGITTAVVMAVLLFGIGMPAAYAQLTISTPVTGSVYNTGDLLTVAGNAGSGSAVSITVRNAADQPIGVAQTTATNGAYSIEVLRFAGTMAYGNYKVVAFSDGETTNVTVEFTFTANFPMPASGVKIVNTAGTTLDAGAISSGSLVVVEASVKNDAPVSHDFAYIVQIKDGNGVVVMFSFQTGTLATGQSLNP